MDPAARFLNEPTPHTLFVTNLPYDFDNEKLVDLVRPVTFPTFVRTDPRRGTGYLSFRSRGDAERAMMRIRGGKLRAKVEFADRHTFSRFISELSDHYRDVGRHFSDFDRHQFDRDRWEHDFGRPWDRPLDRQNRDRERERERQHDRERERDRERDYDDDRRAQNNHWRDKKRNGKPERTRDWNKLAIARCADGYISLRGGVKNLFQRLLVSAIEEYPNIRNSPPPVVVELFEAPAPKKRTFSLVSEKLTVA